MSIERNAAMMALDLDAHRREAEKLRAELAAAREREPTASDLRAVAIAADELEAYIGAIGREDEAHERQAWALKRLRGLLDRAAS